jgi:hypothetical protein
MHFLGQDEWAGLFKQAGFVDVQSERILDDRLIAESLPFPWGGFKSRADLATFRAEIGSLYIVGRKAEVSHALDPYLDQARKDLGQTPAKGSPAGAQDKPGGKRKRFGLF